MKTRATLTIAVAVIMALLLNLALVYADPGNGNGNGTHEPRSKHGPETGTHNGDHGQAGNPGKNQADAHRPAHAQGNGEPDPKPTEEPPTEPTPTPPPQPTPTPPAPSPGNEDSSAADCAPLVIVIDCSGNVTINGEPVTLPITGTQYGVTYTLTR
jgi:outer membrane biosynthesis protein TonB